ncbi:hypothetical protein HOH87_06720 [bacterium]|jgi:flagellar biosynthesis/type III secretory pathway protein FliH|nr:hypothetical protein [bacterium]
MGILKRNSGSSLPLQQSGQMGMTGAPANASTQRPSTSGVLRGMATQPSRTIRIQTVSVNPVKSNQPIETPVSVVETDDVMIPETAMVSEEVEDIEVDLSTDEDIDDVVASIAPAVSLAIEDHEDYQSVVDQAFREGLAKGKAAGDEEFQEKQEDLIAAINSTVQERDRLIEEAKPGALDLAMLIAEHIVRHEVGKDESALLNLVSEAIERITDTDRVIIRVNREDAPLIRENIAYFETKLMGVRTILVQEDINVGRGGILIETDLGYIDSTITTKMAIIKEVFRQVDVGEESSY